jgi:hypothetical protein
VVHVSFRLSSALLIVLREVILKFRYKLLSWCLNFFMLLDYKRKFQNDCETNSTGIALPAYIHKQGIPYTIYMKSIHPPSAVP